MIRPRGTKGIILTSMVGTGMVVIAENAKSGAFPGPKILIGLAVLYVFLGFAADFAPQIAAPLAVVVFLAVLLGNGGKALEGVSSAIAKKPARTRVTTKGGRP